MAQGVGLPGLRLVAAGTGSLFLALAFACRRLGLAPVAPLVAQGVGLAGIFLITTGASALFLALAFARRRLGLAPVAPLVAQGVGLAGIFLITTGASALFLALALACRGLGLAPVTPFVAELFDLPVRLLAAHLAHAVLAAGLGAGRIVGGRPLVAVLFVLLAGVRVHARRQARGREDQQHQADEGRQSGKSKAFVIHKNLLIVAGIYISRKFGFNRGLFAAGTRFSFLFTAGDGKYLYLF